MDIQPSMESELSGGAIDLDDGSANSPSQPREKLTNVTAGDNPDIQRALEAAYKNQGLSPEADTADLEPVLEKGETPPAKDDKFASKFAALSRKERSIQQKEAELKAARAEIERERDQWKAIADKKAKARENPIEWLQEAGLTYDEVTEWMLGNRRSPQEEKLSEHEKLIKEMAQKLEKSETEKAQIEAQTKIDAFKNTIRETVQKKSDDYELIGRFNQYETVYNVIEQHWKQTNRLLSIEEACNVVENFLEQKAEEEAKLFLDSKKLKSKFSGFNPGKRDEPNLDRQQANQPKQQTKTLTNGMAQNSAPAVTRAITDDERLNEAAKLIRFVED
jgi:hypothetical protein